MFFQIVEGIQVGNSKKSECKLFGKVFDWKKFWKDSHLNKHGKHFEGLKEYRKLTFIAEHPKEGTLSKIHCFKQSTVNASKIFDGTCLFYTIDFDSDAIFHSVSKTPMFLASVLAFDVPVFKEKFTDWKHKKIITQEDFESWECCFKKMDRIQSLTCRTCNHLTAQVRDHNPRSSEEDNPEQVSGSFFHYIFKNIITF